VWTKGCNCANVAHAKSTGNCLERCRWEGVEL
jgi:hypothetical protein